MDFTPMDPTEFEQTFHPVFDIVRTKTGAISIRNKLVNETMHNPVGPWTEANALYIDQPRLREKLAQNMNDEFVIFDVGLGAAANALAALTCIHSMGKKSRPVRIVSFERDLELLRFALDHAKYFEHFKGYEAALEELLAKNFWTDGKIAWELRYGDFLELIEKESHKAHLVFYDPYSPKMNEDMWTTRCFKLLRAKCHQPNEGSASLFTYSIATRIRVSMILADFYVGYGEATGAKTETTQASTALTEVFKPLGEAWRERWRKSHIRNSFDCAPADEAAEDFLIEEYLSRVIQNLKPAHQ